jgi:hypothetical protein
MNTTAHQAGLGLAADGHHSFPGEGLGQADAAAGGLAHVRVVHQPNLIYGDGTPVAMIIVGLFYEGPAVLFVFAALAALRHRRSRRRQGMMRPPASAALHGSQQPHHPDLP